MPFCRKCNIEYEEGKKFCKKCGSPLDVQQKINQAEAETPQVPPTSSPSDTKDNVQLDKFLPLTTSAKQEINKYLVLLYFITAGIYFFYSVIFYYRQRQIFLTEYVFFIIILVCGFLIEKIKPSHLAINITFFLLLLSFIVRFIYFIYLHRI